MNSKSEIDDKNQLISHLRERIFQKDQLIASQKIRIDELQTQNIQNEILIRDLKFKESVQDLYTKKKQNKRSFLSFFDNFLKSSFEKDDFDFQTMFEKETIE